MTQLKTELTVLPSILSADFGRFLEEAETVNIPEIDFLHVDVMDGHFVPNLTFGPQVVKTLKKHTRFNLDVHLMIDNAPEFIPAFANAGADIITIHQEAVTHLNRAIHLVKEHGVKAGVTINPATPVEALRWVLTEVDLVLIMSVNPGFGGQDFIPNSVERVRKLAQMRREMNTDFIIEIDGGIEPSTAGNAYLAGARYFVSGSAIFGQQDRPRAVRDIINACRQAEREANSRMV